MTLWCSADVVIVGGGLCGSALGWHLAERGIDPLVLDREHEAGHKVCGEGLMPRGVRELAALGVGPEDVGASPFVGIRWIGDAHEAGAAFPGGRPGWGVRRDRLDAVVRDRARARAEFVTGVRATGLVGPGVLRTDRGLVSARLVVGADGLHSVVRRGAGLHRPARGVPRVGARQRWRLSMPAPDRVEVVGAAWGELYVTPVGPCEVNVAFLLEPGGVRALGGDRSAALATMARATRRGREWLAGAAPMDEPRFAGSMRQVPRSVVGERVVLLGDAAGFVDGVTGEGMSLGLEGARVLAGRIADALHGRAGDVASLRAWSVDHRNLTRSHFAFTDLVVWWVRRPWLRERVLAAFERRPTSFASVLGLHDGSVGPWTALWASARAALG